MRRPLATTTAALLLSFVATGCGLFREKKVDFDHPRVSKPSGIEYVEILTGRGAPVRPGDRVTIDYVAMLDDGTPFDSTYERGLPESFVVGAAPLAGLDEGLLGMRPGGKRRISLPPEHAYGEPGIPGLVPPSSTLIFEVELASVEPGVAEEEEEEGAATVARPGGG